MIQKRADISVASIDYNVEKIDNSAFLACSWLIIRYWARLFQYVAVWNNSEISLKSL